MSDYFMESKQEDGLWIVLVNFEGIYVPEDKIIRLSLQGIKVNKDWITGCEFRETTTAEGFYLALTGLPEEQEKHLLKHQDIAFLHFKDQVYTIEWKGDDDNLYQKTYKDHDTLYINVDKDNCAALVED